MFSIYYLSFYKDLSLSLRVSVCVCVCVCVCGVSTEIADQTDGTEKIVTLGLIVITIS